MKNNPTTQNIQEKKNSCFLWFHKWTKWTEPQVLKIKKLSLDNQWHESYENYQDRHCEVCNSYQIRHVS
jgi:hypothetical protein